ncbi:amino acid ABC transporter permease [Jeotgalibaca sp. A127]|uniref:amino acid ABC transporter permease n=1 Tax=Jeotgalibaca sp. A127 TaxID=3457324 RepID=UPI003FD4FE47
MGNFFDFQLFIDNIPALLEFLPVTIELTILSMIIAVIMGTIIALIRYSKTPVLYHLATIYVSFIRGTPIIVQLFIAYFGIPALLRALNAAYEWGIPVDAVPGYVFAILALGFNESAYLSETFRAALLSVPRGQIEAAQALGMTNGQTLIRIILPEAMTVALPGIGNGLITLMKGTSLSFTTGVVEMTAQGRIIAGRSYRYFEVYVALAIIYWAITIILELVFSYSEGKFSVSDKAPELIQNDPGV